MPHVLPFIHVSHAQHLIINAMVHNFGGSASTSAFSWRCPATGMEPCMDSVDALRVVITNFYSLISYEAHLNFIQKKDDIQHPKHDMQLGH